MSDARPREVTRLLHAIGEGDGQAAEQLLPLIYEELRRLARRNMAREKPGDTLQPTALVHEAYLRLLGSRNLRWRSRGHFFGAAAEAMRRILIERARAKGRLKRGGGQRPSSIDVDAVSTEPDPHELLALDDALTRLEARDELMANVVKLRCFAGLSIQETARALDTSGRSVSRAWTGARAWLRCEMDEGGGD